MIVLTNQFEALQQACITCLLQLQIRGGIYKDPSLQKQLIELIF
jgi:hypothetical protein